MLLELIAYPFLTWDEFSSAAKCEPHRGKSVSWCCSSLHLSLLFDCSKTNSEASISKMARNSNEKLLQTEKSMLQWTNFKNIFSHQRENFLLCGFFFSEMWCSQPLHLMFEFLDKEAICNVSLWFQITWQPEPLKPWNKARSWGDSFVLLIIFSNSKWPHF